MKEGEAMAILLAGRKSERVEVAVTLELDCAIRVMTRRLGGGNMRSEAVRTLLARGAAADPDLVLVARDMAAELRSKREA